MGEQPLSGGGMTRVYRSGDVVHRSRIASSPLVEELLTRLERAGFAYSPRFLGLDREGRQRLRYVPGDAGTYPLTAAVRSATALRSAARVLRLLHDATRDLVASLPDGWLLPRVEPAEVICHGDFAPYNCVFDGERVAAVIDFDTAHPGPRLRDVAYAVYRFAPLMDPAGAESFGSPDEQAARARAFCDAYELDDRSGLVDAVRDRLGLVRAWAAASVAGPGPAADFAGSDSRFKGGFAVGFADFAALNP